MSLINDALKRAQEAQRPNVPSGVASMRTIETRPRERPFFSRILVVVIFLLLAAAFAFIDNTRASAAFAGAIPRLLRQAFIGRVGP